MAHLRITEMRCVSRLAVSGTGRPRIGENGEDVTHGDQIDTLGPEPGEHIRLQARPPRLLGAASALPLPGMQGDHPLSGLNEPRNAFASGIAALLDGPARLLGSERARGRRTPARSAP